ncbi:MAG: GNAT family N-acetyltransferase [Candidatus Hydrogenedentes bacterium]|nr:GNAT family N-acetyltransferase [Candidatus Hydrogenedentota bacterium]
MIQKFILEAEEKGAKRLRVELMIKNKGALKFYKALGFGNFNITLERNIS